MGLLISRDRRTIIRAIFALFLVAVLGVLGYTLDAPAYIRRAMEWIDARGHAGVLFFILLYALLSVMLVPGSISTLTAGAVFGVVRGSVYASLGATLGATAAFFIARYLARDAVQRFVNRRRTLRAVDQAIRRDGWKLVGLLRLSPVVPWSMSNYVYGITPVKPLGYIGATWAGMLPGTIVYAYIGALAGTAAVNAGGERSMTPAQWILTGVGLAATIVVMAMISRSVRGAVSRAIEER